MPQFRAICSHTPVLPLFCQVSLLRQLVCWLTAAKFVLAKTMDNPVSEALMSKLKETFPDVLEAVPEDQRGHIKATPEFHTTCGYRASCRREKDAQQ